MSLIANVIYHEERAHHFGDGMVACDRAGLLGDACFHAFTFYRLRYLAHLAAWRALVLAASVEG